MKKETNLFTPQYSDIDEYGIIGDLRTAALVAANGSIDFLCMPEFDSPSIFCANADKEKGGKFQIAPLHVETKQRRLYIPDTNILLTRFLSDDGIAELTDFMVPDDDESSQMLVRRIKSVSGSLKFRIYMKPSFNYARSSHTVEEVENGVIFSSEGEDGLRVRLRSEIDLTVQDDGSVTADFTLEPGEHHTFVLEPVSESGEYESDSDHASATLFKRTSNYWRTWLSFSKYDGRWQETVHRSALALKVLTSKKHGSMVAAPCFGFPNEIGGERNWDYRYTWIRDASFTTYGLMRLGFTDTADSFMKWIEDRVGEDGDLQIMYKLDGSPINDEFFVDDMEGYMGSKPVRIGSTNHDQLQLDIYGELLDSVYFYDKMGKQISHDFWTKLVTLVEFVCENWKKPDSGIWEVRGGNREFLYSRLMCWVALDRGIKLAQGRGLPSPETRWVDIRNEIYNSIHNEFWDKDREAFIQFKGGKTMDASTLMMPLVQFISPTDPRWLSTLEAIEEDLVYDSLVYRYNVGEAFSDCLEGTEGTFSICSFWYIEAVSRSGQLQKARYLFEKMLGYGNELHLFSEQLGRKGEFLGNVPQAFTHLALISTAFDLDRRLENANQRYL